MHPAITSRHLYYAFTTTNAAHGWKVIAEARTRREAERLAREALGTAGDLYRQTEIRNLMVLSKSAAGRLAVLRTAIERWLLANNIEE